MVDVRRAEGEDHMSPTGLSPAFGNIGFNPSGNMSNPDILSPLSPTTNDRYGYPLSAGPRTSNPYGRHNSLDTSMQMQNRQGIRPLQPLQLRETMSRSRSDNLQSPLRSSMSWKGDSIDYSSYQNQHNSPQIGSQNRSVYPQDQMGATSSSMGYDSTYSSEFEHEVSQSRSEVTNMTGENSLDSAVPDCYELPERAALQLAAKPPESQLSSAGGVCYPTPGAGPPQPVSTGGQRAAVAWGFNHP